MLRALPRTLDPNARRIWPACRWVTLVQSEAKGTVVRLTEDEERDDET